VNGLDEQPQWFLRDREETVERVEHEAGAVGIDATDSAV
jgi:hypothetical protein